MFGVIIQNIIAINFIGRALGRLEFLRKLQVIHCQRTCYKNKDIKSRHNFLARIATVTGNARVNFSSCHVTDMSTAKSNR